MKIAPFTSCYLLLLVAGCTQETASRLAAVRRIAPADLARFRHVKGDFYRDKAGKLFEQRESVRDEGATFDTWYDSTIVVPKGDGGITLPLADVIDPASYQQVGNSLFSKDKKRVYYSYLNSGGGFRVVVSGANPATFRASLDYQYGFDDQHGFYCAEQLHGLRMKRWQLLYEDADAGGGHFIAYIKDDQHVFYEGTPVPGADAPTFHLVRGQKWEAADKNHRYQCCGQRLN